EVVSARAAYAEDLAISKKLADFDKANASWQISLIYTHMKLAEIGVDAQVNLEAGLKIAEALAAKDALAQENAWMLDDLKEKLAALKKG
ncbi:MAG: hypothetical protein ACRCU5_15590, partial [Rhizobiaceae bacterium]